MQFECKCGSVNVDVWPNKKGALVGKCNDCKKWGNYGKQSGGDASEKAGASKGIEGKEKGGSTVGGEGKCKTAASSNRSGAGGGSDARRKGRAPGGREKAATGKSGGVAPVVHSDLGKSLGRFLLSIFE